MTGKGKETPAVRNALEQLRPHRSKLTAADLATAQEVVVIASPFRSGSTLLMEVLRASPDLLHFQAEMQPVLRLGQALFPENGHEDDTCVAEADIDFIRGELAAELGRPARRLESSNAVRMAADIAWRQVVEWDTDQPRLDTIVDWLDEELGGDPDTFYAMGGEELEGLHLRLLKRFEQHNRRFNPYYYDCDWASIRSYFPDIAIPAGPHLSSRVMEWAPFDFVTPWIPADPEDLRMPIVTKSASNSHRLRLIKRLFPDARIRVIHLTRQAAGNINSLCEGWLSPWFFNTEVNGELRIEGYTHAEKSWSQKWWCFDFPNGWSDWKTASLPEVCGMQWASAHREILDFISGGRVPRFEIRYEDLAAGNVRPIEDVCEWLGISSANATRRFCSAPRLNSWRASPTIHDPNAQAARMQRALACPIVRDMECELGYHAS